MTRRLMLAILLTVWSILLIAGTATYVTARTKLLAELDRRVRPRAGAAGDHGCVGQTVSHAIARHA